MIKRWIKYGQYVRAHDKLYRSLKYLRTTRDKYPLREADLILDVLCKRIERAAIEETGHYI